MRKWILVLAALLALAGGPAFATDFWVATTGSDANPGTQASPFLTIGHADAAAVAGFAAGSTIHVAPGTYAGSIGTIGATVAGTAASPVIYLCDVKWSCLIKPTAAETNNYALKVGGAGTLYINNISAIATNSANCSGTPPCIKITLTAPAGRVLATNDYVAVEGVANNTAANGRWQITVIDQSNFTLNGSAFLNSAGAAGHVRHGGAAAYTIIDGFELDGTYPGSGVKWFTGIGMHGYKDIARNIKVHDFAYIPRADDGSSGGAGLTDSFFYGGSSFTFNNNYVYQIGPKASLQTRIHGIYLQGPLDTVFNNVVWAISGSGIEVWHDATAVTFVNNTCVDCMDGAPPIQGSGDYEWPHILAGTPTNGSNIVTFDGVNASTAGLAVGMGVYDTTHTTCITNASYTDFHITSVDSTTQIHISGNAVSGCAANDVLQFGGPDAGTYGANNLCYNSAGSGDGTNVGAATYTNNLGYLCPRVVAGSNTFANDITSNPNFVQYTLNDGYASDYHLNSTSPAIAAGLASASVPTYDFEGNPVPGGAAPDIGAYVYNPHPHPTVAKYPNAIVGSVAGGLTGGYSPFFHNPVYAQATPTRQGTNGFGGQWKIADLDGVGDAWFAGRLTLGYPSTGDAVVCDVGVACLSAMNIMVGGVELVPSPTPSPIVNASMEFDQQLAVAGTAYTVTAGGLGTLDGWNAKATSAATITVTQCSAAACTDAPPPGFTNYLRVKVTAGSATVNANDFLVIRHPIEANDITSYGLGASTAVPSLCLSWWSKTNAANRVFTGSILNAALTRGYPFVFAESGATGQWVNHYLCPPADITGTWVTTGVAEGMRLQFALEAGSAFNTTTCGYTGIVNSAAWVAGAWQSTSTFCGASNSNLTTVTGGTWDITGVQLTASPYPIQFTRRSIAEETARVQRYAWRLAEPGAGVNVGGCNATAAAVQTCAIPLPTTMRAAPTCTITTGTFAENMGGTATLWVSPAGGTSTPNTATITTANTLDVAGAFHMLQGAGGSGVIYCSARL